METPKRQFSTRVSTSLGDPDAPSPTALVMKPLNVLNRWVGGIRGGHQSAIGGAWLAPDSATRCHGARWEMAYSPRTCTTCRLHVRLHAMEIERRRFAARVRGVRAGRHSHDGLSRFHGADARGWLTVTHPRGREKALKPFGWIGRRAERIMGARPEMLRRGVQADRARLGRREDGARHRGSRRALRHPCPEPLNARRGRMSTWRTPMRRGEPARSRALRRGLSDAANAGEPAYPLSYNGAGEGVAPAPPSNPPRVALPWRSRMGAPPPSPRVGAA